MAVQNKKPMTKGVAKVPVIMQLEALECGAASLAMVLAYYNKWIPLEQVRADCGVSRDGSSAKKIIQAAKYYHLSPQPYRYDDVETIRKEGTFPCIIHWNFNHFVVLDGFKGNQACLNDPARGTCRVSIEEFDRAFTGVAIEFEPDEAFEPGGKPKSVLAFAKERLKGTGNAIAFTMITGLIAAFMGILTPGFSRVFLDRLLTGKNPEWLTPFLLLLGVIYAIQIIMSALQAVYSLRINGKMAVTGNATYMWQVLRLPMSFFSQRMIGDIQGRQSTNATIANTLISTFAPLLINCGMLIFYLVVMLRYSLLLTAVGLLSLVLNIVVADIISKKRINITRVSMRDAAKLASTTTSGIEMIETIKSAGAETGFFAKWAGYQAGVNTQNIAAIKVNRYLGLIPGLVSSLANNVVLILGVWLAMNGEFTIGMVMAFQGFLTSFMAPAQSLISSGQTVQEMRTQMERIEDVMTYPTDDVFAPDNGEPLKDEKLTGNLTIRDLTFGYSPLDAPLIENFNLTLKPGQTVAIVGRSGCGKSTVSKIISGLYQPWSGEVLFDGRPIREINATQFHSSVAVVDQDIILFEDTIANNIKMWDDSIADFEMIIAANDAKLHDDIMRRPKGYQYKLIDGGKDFSGGQRQRMEIARVLAQDPTILIMDEATSALDAKTEYELVKAIRDRGITCIVVAHRLSTIRSADEIIVMEKGKIVDRGTHQSLMKSCELYQNLVTAE